MNNVYNEPKYDTDLANKGYVDKQVGVAETNAKAGLATKSKNFGSQPTPPYRVNDTWMNGTDIYICVRERLIGSFVASDWAPASTYDNTKSILDGGVTTNGTLVVAKGGTVAAGLTAYTSGDDGVRMWAGSDINGIDSAPFRVTQRGYLYASNANITGGSIAVHSSTPSDTMIRVYRDNSNDEVMIAPWGIRAALENGGPLGSDNFGASFGFMLGMPAVVLDGTYPLKTYQSMLSDQMLLLNDITDNKSSTVTPTEITTPKITAGNIDCGTCTLNAATDKTISFNKTFDTAPIVILTCTQNNTGTTVYSGSVIATTTTGFTAFCMSTSGSGSNIGFNWIAIGS